MQNAKHNVYIVFLIQIIHQGWIGVFKKGIIIFVILLSVSVAQAAVIYEGQDYKFHSLSSVGIADNIMVDGNGDGDIKDEEDYLRYSHILITDTTQGVKFKPANIIEDKDAGIQNMDNFVIEFLTFNGKSYFVAETSDDDFKASSDYVLKKLYTQQPFSPENSPNVTENIHMGLDSNKNLYVIYNGTILGFVERSSVSVQTEITSAIKEFTDILDDYRVFVYKKDSNWVEVVLILTEKLSTFEDNQNDIEGYDLVRINADDLQKGSGRIIFFGKEYELSFSKDLKVKIKFDDPSYYNFEMDYMKKQLSGSLGYIPKTQTKESVETAWRGLQIKGEANELYLISKLRLSASEIRVDNNGDGDVYDKEDYPIYNKFYVIDAPSSADIRLVYAIEAPMINEFMRYSITQLVGTVVKIQGGDYVINQAEEDSVTLGKNPVLKTLAKQETSTVEEASLFMDNLKLGFSDDPLTDSSKDLYIYLDEDLVGTIPLNKNEKDLSYEASLLSDDLSNYGIVVANFSSEQAYVAVFEKSGIIKITDESKGVLGYDKVYVNSNVIKDGKGVINFLSKVYNLKPGGNATIEDYPYYTIQLNTFSEARVVREKLPIIEEEEETVEIVEEEVTIEEEITEEILEEIITIENVTEDIGSNEDEIPKQESINLGTLLKSLIMDMVRNFFGL